MKRSFKNWDEFYQRINLIFNALIAVSLLPFGWLMLEMEGNGNKIPLIREGSSLYIQVAGIVLILFLLVLAHKRSQAVLSELEENNTMAEKLSLFYEAYFQMYLLIEFAAVVAFIEMFLVRNYLFVTVYVFILFWFSFIRPTYDLVVKKLKLNSEERKMLESEEDFD